MEANVRKNWFWLIISVVVIVLSAVMAHFLERDFGKVDVDFVKFVDPSGNVIAAKLFRPVDATTENKMPGILNLHGGQNDKTVQDPLSIELARRGFVVLATDGIGHGDSQGAYEIGRVFGDPTYTFGAEIGYRYLQSLPFVDTDKMGLTGHTTGTGWYPFAEQGSLSKPSWRGDQGKFSIQPCVQLLNQSRTRD